MQGFHFRDKLVVELVPSCVALEPTYKSTSSEDYILKTYPGL